MAGGLPDAREALERLLAGAGLDPALADRAEFEGADPIYPTPFRIGDAAAVALGAVRIAADLLQGRHRTVSVDARLAALSTQGFRHISLDGEPVTSPRDPLTGFYPTREGRSIFLHLNFAHHRARIFRVLGEAETREDLARSVSGWDADRLESAVVAEGACAAVNRSRAEWLASDQGQAVAELPPIEILRIGEGAPRPLPGGSEPLSGLAVVDFTRVLAGPICGRTLGELGADVTRIENPHYPDLLPYQFDANRNKQRRRLDLRSPKELAELRALVGEADIFLQAYRSGVAEQFGLGPAEVAAARPGAIYVTLSAYGHLGPSRSGRGFDSALQAATGMADIQGGGAPKLLPTSPIDYLSGYLLAFGATAALHRRASEGGSYLVRGSLAQTAEWMAGFGLLEDAEDRALAPDALARLVRSATVESDAPEGRLRHLRSPLAARVAPAGRA